MRLHDPLGVHPKEAIAFLGGEQKAMHQEQTPCVLCATIVAENAPVALWAWTLEINTKLVRRSTERKGSSPGPLWAREGENTLAGPPENRCRLSSVWCKSETQTASKTRSGDGEDKRGKSQPLTHPKTQTEHPRTTEDAGIALKTGQQEKFH